MGAALTLLNYYEKGNQFLDQIVTYDEFCSKLDTNFGTSFNELGIKAQETP